MKLFPHQLSEEHIGLVCVVHHSGAELGFTAHSHIGGLEGEGRVHVSLVTIGRICMVTRSEIVFLKSATSRWSSGLSWPLGPRINLNPDITEIALKSILPREGVYVNCVEGSNSVAQHLRRSKRTSGFGQIGRRLLQWMPDM